jgi:hypothetical protein
MVRSRPAVLTIAAVIAAATTATGLGTAQFVGRSQHQATATVQTSQPPVVHLEDGEGS